MNNDNIQQAAEASRVFSHCEINDLTSGFSLKSKQPFSLCVVEKASINGRVISTPDTSGLLVDCKCLRDTQSSDLPVQFNAWTEAGIEEIAEDAIDLTLYRVFVGVGVSVDES